jgi:hypothetical protein
MIFKFKKILLGLIPLIPLILVVIITPNNVTTVSLISILTSVYYFIEIMLSLDEHSTLFIKVHDSVKIQTPLGKYEIIYNRDNGRYYYKKLNKIYSKYIRLDSKDLKMSIKEMKSIIDKSMSKKNKNNTIDIKYAGDDSWKLSQSRKDKLKKINNYIWKN